jgi:glycosyltransferase involved in cell wall biosynthesis
MINQENGFHTLKNIHSQAMPPEPRRVLLVEQNRDGTAGGSYQSLYDIARSLDRTRYRPEVLFHATNRFVDRLTAAGVPVHIWQSNQRPSRITNAIGGIFDRVGLLRRLKIDIVHLNNQPANGADDWLPAARFRRIPCITHARVMVRPGHDAIHRWLQRRYDLVLPDSRHVAEAVIATTGIARERVRVVYEGVDADAFRQSIRRPPEAVRQQHGIQPDDVLIVMAGHLRPWKGQHVLVDALARVKDRSRVKAIFVGGTPEGHADYAAQLNATAAATGISDMIAFVGERNDVADFMNAADIVVHASIDPEPFGIVVVEGMALGKAVLASALGGPLEIITPGTGMLFNPAKPEELAAAIDRASSDPSFRAALGRAAVERADVFSVRALVSGTEAAYDTVLSH